MALIDDVKTICDRLAPLGWRDLLLRVSNNALDIRQASADALKAALTKPLTTVDRTVPGFADLKTGTLQGVAAGEPARSLLYHALASPEVHPTSDGRPAANAASYATLLELDTLENFIYSLAAGRQDLANTVVAVFAYQYRPASRTAHLRHSDMAYSRTGVARVGTAEANYDASRRGFWVAPSAGADRGLAVLPARYGVFLARRAKPGAAGSVQGGHNGAADADFMFPVHKLFAGGECLTGRTIAINFLEFHRSDKLARTHSLSPSQGGLPVPAGVDLSKPPYVRDSLNGGGFATLKPVGSSVLVVPSPSKTLVRTASQKVGGTDRIAHFMVPAATEVRGRETRFATSTLEIPAFGDDRLAPEYVNIRHQVNPAGPATQTPVDLNTQPAAAFNSTLRNGGYAAAHFIDDSCDGCVEAVVSGIDGGAAGLPAFSLITAPDFFPLADQIEVETDPTIRLVEPLSKGRLAVNPRLPRPSNPNVRAFERSDRTVTAVVGANAVGPAVAIAGQPNRMVSFLPDAASNVFAPGWDTSRSRDAQGVFLTSSGLGSPFPEDAKLCAALASFWPAVAPDNGRTFGNQGFGNQLPMLDEELGFHPKHPRVAAGEVRSERGWDGEFGPFFERVGNATHVNYVDIARSDYVSNALAGLIRVNLTAEVQSEDLISRHQALNRANAVLQLPNGANVCLVVVRRVTDWRAFGAGRPELTGRGFHLEFAELTGAASATTEINRLRRRVRKTHVCQVAGNGVAYKNGSQAFRFIP